MIWVIAIVAGAAPQLSAEQAFEAYGQCLRTEVDAHRHAATPVEVARASIASCAASRDALRNAAIDLKAAEIGTERASAWADERIRIVDSIVPAMVLDRPVRIVPISECASELKDVDQCLE